MKTNVSLRLKRSLIAILVVLFLSAVCGFGLLKFNQNQNAFADVSAPTAEDTVIEAEGLVLNQSASIRLTGNAIRFSTTVNKGWHSTVTAGATEAIYFATINKVGDNSLVKAIAFKENGPSFAGDALDSAEYTFYTYLNFGNASEAVLAEALTTEFESAVYLRVTRPSSDDITKNEVVFYKAQNSNEVKRSMRAVANNAWLTWEDGVGYTQEDLLNMGYFTPTFRSEDDYAVVSTDNTLYANMPGAPEQISAIYVDDVKVGESYTVANFDKEGKYITVFDENGKAYSTTYDTGYTTISNLDEWKSTIAVAGAILADKYALVADVVIGDIADVGNALTGTFNGLGHALTNVYVTGGAYKALFSNGGGSTIKNLNMNVRAFGTNGAALIGFLDYPEVETITTIENCTIQTDSTGYCSGLVVGVMRRGNVLKVDNCAFLTRKIGTDKYNGVIVNIMDGASAGLPASRIEATNTVYTEGGLAGVNVSSSNNATGLDAYLDSAALAKAVANGDETVPAGCFEFLEKIGKLVVLTNENITKLQTATSGEWVLVEDIDMSKQMNPSINGATVTASPDQWTPTAVFTGSLDGNGYSFKNMLYNGGKDYAGVFHKLTGATIKNVGFEMHSTSNRAGIAGQIVGTPQTILENVVIRCDKVIGASGAAITGVLQGGGVLVKDSIIVIGTASHNNWSVIGDQGATNAKAVFDNVVMVNKSGAPLVKPSVTNISDNYIANTSGAEVVNGTDYYLYSTVEAVYDELQKEVPAFTLPKSVIDLAYHTDVFHELNASNIKDLMSAKGSGYWYITEDIDMQEAGAQSWAYTSGVDNSHTTWYVHPTNGSEYWLSNSYSTYANIEIDGQGHKLSNFTFSGDPTNGIISGGYGATFKNLYIHYAGGASGTYTAYLAGVNRDFGGATIVETYNFENLFLEFDSFGNTNGGIFNGFSDGVMKANVKNVYINVKAAAIGGSTRLFFGHNMSSTSTATFTKCYVVGASLFDDAGALKLTFSKDGITMKDSTGATYSNTAYNSDLVFATTKEDLQALNSGDDWNYIRSEAYAKVTVLNYEYFGVCHIHTGGEWVVTNPSTCVDHGTKVQYCIRCGEIAKEEQIEELGDHTPGEWVVTNPSTCTEHGTQVQKCSICSEHIEGTETQAPLALHTAGEWEVVTEATCGVAGYKVLKCTACAQEIEEDIIDATGMHVEGGWYELVEPGCAVEGVEIQKCGVCSGELARRAIAPTREHIAGAWEIDVMPTKEQEGRMVKLCQDCDYLFDEQKIAKLDNDVDFDIEDILGADHEHVLGDWVVEDEATCGKDGLKIRRCTTCQKVVETEVIPATLDHEISETWKVEELATCVADGIRIKNCTECGEIAIKAIYSDPDNHKAGDWEVSIPATCAKGLDIKNCDLCGIQLEERVSDPTGEHVVPETWEVDVPATCVEGRDVKYCEKGCGTLVDSKITVPVKGHTASGVWETYVSPSCTTTGTNVQKCTECDRVALSEENALPIDANAHVVGPWVVNAETGERERSCVICGEVIKTGSLEGFAKTNLIAINQNNISELMTATKGYYYLTEDIDMAQVCANGGWNSNSTFTGTLDGRGYTLTNFQGGNGGYQGLFFRLGDGAIIKDLAVKITNVNYRVGFIGQVLGGATSQVLIERVALYYENMAFDDITDVARCASAFVHVTQADLLVKDSFVYIAQTGKYNSAYTGYIFGGEAASVNPRVQNVHVMSPVIKNALGSSKVNIADINYNLAQEGKDYFRYSSAEQLTGAFANSQITLPESVIAQMTNLGVFEAHDCVAGAEFVTYIAPTCAISGVNAKLCVTCGKPMETEEVAKLPHAIEKNWHLGEQATCVSEGYNYKKCLTCGEIIAKQEIAIDTNNHVNLTWEMVNGQMTGTCDCGHVVSHQMTVPTYHNDNTETFSIWAYGATPGKWISWIEDGVTIKSWLLPTGQDGAVQYVLESEFPRYYYDDAGKLQRSEEPIWEIDPVTKKQVILIPGLDYVTQDDAVYMTTTTENGTLDVYKQANFNTLFYTFGIDFSYADFEGSFAEQVFDWAQENGMKVIAQGGYFHSMASQKTPLVDPVYGSVYTEGMAITDETKFKTQADLNRFAVYELRNVIKHPAFKGITFIDEPTWDMFVAMGELAQAVEAAEDYYDQEIYVMINLLPYAMSDAHFKLYNGIGLTGYNAYEYYLNTYYENVGKYVGYVQYDDYPLRVKGYAGNREIIQYYIRTHQFTSDWAREKGIERAMAVQSYGDRAVTNSNGVIVDTGRRGCSPEDILWQMNISAAFGVKDFTYYTYFPIINTADNVDDNGGEFIVDRDGNKTKSYAGVQQANAELLVKGKALMNFEYQDMKIFTAYSTANGANKDDCYFFAGCGNADCTECACINGTLKYVDGATVNFGRGAILITELVDETTGYRGYYVVNITDPTDMISGSVTIDISDLFNSVQIYKGTEVITQALVNGQITIDLGVGDGALIIPYNA